MNTARQAGAPDSDVVLNQPFSRKFGFLGIDLRLEKSPRLNASKKLGWMCQ